MTRHVKDIIQGLWAYHVGKGLTKKSSVDFITVQIAFLFCILIFPIFRFFYQIFDFSSNFFIWGNVGLLLLFDVAIGIYIKRCVTLDDSVMRDRNLKAKIKKGSIFFYLIIAYWLCTSFVFYSHY